MVWGSEITCTPISYFLDSFSLCIFLSSIWKFFVEDIVDWNYCLSFSSAFLLPEDFLSVFFLSYY